jgi:hypothetical protein
MSSYSSLPSNSIRILSSQDVVRSLTMKEAIIVNKAAFQLLDKGLTFF